MVKKLLIGGVVLGAGVLVYMKFFKKTEPTVLKWEDFDEETVREKAKQIRIGVNQAINDNINKTTPSGDMAGLFGDGININWDKADFGDAFPNYG